MKKKKKTKEGFRAGAHEILVKLQRSRTSTCTGQWRSRHNLHAFFRIPVSLVTYDSGQVSLEHCLLSWYNNPEYGTEGEPS